MLLKYFIIFINVVTSLSFVACRYESVINTMYLTNRYELFVAFRKNIRKYSLRVYKQ